MIKVAADKYLLNIAKFLPRDKIKLRLFDPDQPLQQLPNDIQGLLIRSVTKINADTLADLPPALEFVATGSAGMDHVDIPYLKKHHIAFANAAGCNARSVAEYVATALLFWSKAKNMDLANCSLGIIGVGHVGRAVDKQARALGLNTILYDPPRQQREPSFQSAEREEVLQCDILTLHTPLSRNGQYPTFHWLDTDFLQNYSFKLILNSARGGVVDEEALLKAAQRGGVEDYILDVWEDEPYFDDEVAQKAFIKTPHIAGYSLQAKTKASSMICEALFEHFGIPAPQQTGETADVPTLDLSGTSLPSILSQLHPLKDYQQQFIKLLGLPPEIKKAGFNKIRAHHPLRHEFSAINLPDHIKEQYPILRRIIHE